MPGGQKGQREGGLVSRVYTPKRATSLATLETSLAAWRNHRAEYLADGKNMEEYAQVNAIKLLVPTDLEQLIRDQGDRLNKLAELENFISYQLASRSTPVFEGSSSKGSDKSLLRQLKAALMSEEPNQFSDATCGEQCGTCGPDGDGFLMAMKGLLKGGKAGGKGTFTGECFYCKRPGHRQADCEIRKADVQAGKVPPLPQKGFGKGGGTGGEQKGAWTGKGASAGKGGKSNNLFAWVDQLISSPSSTAQSNAAQGNDSSWSGWAMCTEKYPSSMCQNEFRSSPSYTHPNKHAALGDTEEEDVHADCAPCADVVSRGSDLPPPAHVPGPAKHQCWDPSCGPRRGVRCQRVPRKKWPPLACPLMELSARDVPLTPAPERSARGLPQKSPDTKDEGAHSPDAPSGQAEELLCSLGVTTDRESGYRKVRSVMDSGATKSVMHPDSFPDRAIQPSPGSKRGAVFCTAGTDEIPNLGMWTLPAESAEGTQTVLRTQVAEVSLPLSSVGEACDEGNLVIVVLKAA